MHAGDKGNGTIPRRDVATVVVDCVKGLCKGDVTFEVYTHCGKDDPRQGELSYEHLVPDST